MFRLLGHVLLCGVLYVAYQSDDRVKGQYMICVLYKSCLVLATTNRVFAPYNVVAAIALANGTVEEPDNGRGTYIKFYLFQAIDKSQDFSVIPLNIRGNLSLNQVIDCSKSY